MKTNVKTLEKTVIMNTMCPGYPRYNKFHKEILDAIKHFRKELQEKYEQALVENTKTTDSSHLNFTLGQLRTLREVLGEEE